MRDLERDVAALLRCPRQSFEGYLPGELGYVLRRVQGCMADIRMLIPRYPADHGLDFEGEVFRKRARRLGVTSWLDQPNAPTEEEAS